MKLKHYGLALVPVCFTVFIFRALELILAIDPKTGYFTSGAVLPMVFDVILAVIALLFCSVLLKKKEPKPAVVRLYRATLFDTIAGIAASVLLVGSALYGFFVEIATRTTKLDLSLIRSVSFWNLLLAALMAIFVIFFVTYPKKSAKQNFWRLLSLSVTVYYLFRLIVSFQDPDVVFSRAFGIYQITFYGLAAASAINFSKILARMFGRKIFILFTCLMAVLMALRLADAVLYLIPGNPYMIPMDLLSYLADLCITALMLSQMKKLMKAKKRKRPAPEPETDAAPESLPEESATNRA